MKFCIDCVHFEESTGLCLKASFVDLVNGQANYRLAGLERTLDYSGCGKDGKNYKPLRPPVELDMSDLDDLSTIPFGSQHG